MNRGLVHYTFQASAFMLKGMGSKISANEFSHDTMKEFLDTLE